MAGFVGDFLKASHVHAIDSCLHAHGVTRVGRYVLCLQFGYTASNSCMFYRVISAADHAIRAAPLLYNFVKCMCMFCGVVLFLSQLVLLLLTIQRVYVWVCDALFEWPLAPAVDIFSSWIIFCEFSGSMYVMYCLALSVAVRFVFYILLMVNLHSRLLSIIIVKYFIRIFSLLCCISSFIACWKVCKQVLRLLAVAAS